MNQRNRATAKGIAGVARHFPWTTASTARQLQFVHQIADANAEGFGYAQQCVQADPLFSTFNFANINRVQVGFFGQTFLAQTSQLAAVADGVTEDFQLARTRHSFLGKQDCPKHDTPNMGLFLSCTFSGERVKKLKIGVRKNGSGPRMGASRFMKKKKKVLVVENGMPTVMMMVSLLTQAGFDVEAAAKGQKGMEIAQERKFDLIVLETDLPDLSGFKICAELKQRHISYRTPIVFISNRHGDEYRERALDLGAADFIENPFEGSGFVSRISSHLEKTATA